MKSMPFQKRTLALIAVLVPLLALFVYVALRSGPLSPVSIVLATVESKSLSPALFGIGTVEARRTYKIGPIFAGRIKTLNVDVGDRVKTGQVLGKMDPVDLDQRILAQDSAINRARAQIDEARVREEFAQTQATRYEQLLKARSTSEELAATKKQELLVARVVLTATHQDLMRVQADKKALEAQRKSLSLISPIDGLVILCDGDPGTTMVPGQAVVELIDPDELWINARLDQIYSQGLRSGLSARIKLRSQAGEFIEGSVIRVEPLADPVTEETLAKVVFDRIPDPLPRVGELAEVTIVLPTLEAMPIIPNAAIHHVKGRLGVWQVVDKELRFTPITPGITDLSGYVQIKKGLKESDQVVVYSENTLNEQSRIHVVYKIPGVKP
ncbi:efflux RND transporter periplasmic adaptor subunit [Desulfobacula sp.]